MSVRILDLEIDLAKQELRRSGQLIDLPDLSFRLLAELVKHAPDTISKDDLIREVWGDVVVGDETLAQRARLLRQALGDDGSNPRYFSSVRGRGYRLICPVFPSPMKKEATGSRRVNARARWLTTAAIAILVAVSIWLFSRDSEQEPVPLASNTIAVLPFVDLSPDKNYGYFADGMQEELLTRLTKMGSLEVSSRTSTEQFRSTDFSLPTIANRLGVGFIIEGSVRIIDNRVRITVQLIDAIKDRHLWAEIFERELTVENIFLIQEEVAGKIAEALQLEYESSPSLTSPQLPTNSLDAYNAYLLGRYHIPPLTRENLDLAANYLEEATRLDPEFAEAHAWLGWAYSFLGTSYGGREPKEVYPLAKQAALRSLSLDSELSEARTLYADILTWFDWDFVAAEREYLNTIELDPDNVVGYALLLSTQLRHDEAIAMIERLLQADPNNPYVHINAAWRFLDARQYSRAIEEANLAQNHVDANSVVGFANLAMGATERAIAVFEQDLNKRNRAPQQLSNLARAYWMDKRPTQAEALFAELQLVSDKEFVSPVLLAAVYFAAGDLDSGFTLLEEATELKVREVIFLQVHHYLDDHRDDPRYKELVRTIGFR